MAVTMLVWRPPGVTTLPTNRLISLSPLTWRKPNNQVADIPTIWLLPSLDGNRLRMTTCDTVQ